MMNNCLYAWIGNTDLKCFEEDLREQPGPIAYTVQNGRYNKVVLFFNHISLNWTGYDQWILDLTREKSGKEISIDILDRPLDQPTDFGAIYEIVTNELSQRPDEKRFYHLSPGTPAMAAVWILVASGPYPARLIESSIKNGVREVILPFDITASYRPEAAQFTKSVMTLSGGFPPETSEFKMIITQSENMKRVLLKARKAAAFSVPILLLGESGTGKELFARAIHSASSCKTGALVSVNCGAIPNELLEAEMFGFKKGSFTGAIADKTGYLEQANGGTLFLDEIGDLPLSAQVKLLRALQSGTIRPVGSEKDIKINFRIIAATNKNLMNEVRLGHFREDLYHRLAVALLNLPPLRERGGDVELLLDFLGEQINKELSSQSEGLWTMRTLSEDAKRKLVSHSWIGNIRELQNTLTRLFLWSEKAEISGVEVESSLMDAQCLECTADEFQFKDIGSRIDLNEERDLLTRHYISQAMEKSGGVKKKAADLLGLNNYQTLDNWLKKLDIK